MLRQVVRGTTTLLVHLCHIYALAVPTILGLLFILKRIGVSNVSCLLIDRDCIPRILELPATCWLFTRPMLLSVEVRHQRIAAIPAIKQLELSGFLELAFQVDATIASCLPLERYIAMRIVTKATGAYLDLLPLINDV